MIKKILLTTISALVLTFCVSVKQDDATFVLVQGAWHEDWAWFKLEYELIKAGYDVVNVNLPGHGTDITNAASILLPHYVNAIFQAIDTLENEVYCIKSEHSPFFSHTVSLKNILTKIVKNKSTRELSEYKQFITQTTKNKNYDYEHNF
ncbi:MAG: hypothetical protein MI922_29705 [Bacteroidales bacterium]|nr:hypothetical protein [Bacteroidales bacterium]